MFVVALAALLTTSAFALLRALLGPTVYDRILAVNMFGTKTVLLIALTGYLLGRVEFLDLAIVYTLLNFIGVVAVLKFTSYGNFAQSDEPEPSNKAES